MKRFLHTAMFLFFPALLMSQTDVTIGYGASSGGSWSGGNPDVWTSTTWNSKLNVGEIESRLNAGTSVTIATTDGSIMDSAGVVIRKTAGGDATLKFLAYGTSSGRSSINFNTADTIIATSGKLHLIFNADADGNSDGSITGRVYNNGNTSAGIYFESNGGDIIYGGGSDPAATPAYGGTYGLAGVWLNGVKNIAGSGTISLRGIGNGSWSGVQVSYASEFQTTGDITMIGTGGNASFGSGAGVAIASDGTILQTTNGTITITGTGGSGATYGAQGVAVNGGASILSANGNITITGTGGSSPNGYNDGVHLSGYYVNDPLVQTENGTITITGTAGANGVSSDNYGILMQDGARVNATGTGSVVMTGTGKATNYRGNGIQITNGQSTPGFVHTNSGSITITATGGATTSAGSPGLYLYSYGTNSYINSVTGTIAIHSTSISGGDAMFMQGDNTSIESGGDISIIADRTGTGAAGHGLTMSFNPKIKAFGTANITIVATGSSAGSSSCGLEMYSGSPLISSEQGSILITANGGGASGNGNHGIDMWSGAAIYAAGSGDVRITATAGNSGYGMNLANNTRIQTDSGSMVIAATGSGSTYGLGYYRSGGGYGLINNYGDTLSLTVTGTGTSQTAMDGYGSSTIGSSTFPGELIIRTTGAGNDHLNLSAFTVAGTGHLSLAPSNASVPIGLGSGAGAFNLSSSDLGAIANGFHRITIGQADGSGTMTINGASFSDSLELLTGSGSITMSGSLSNSGNSIDITTDGTVIQTSSLTAARLTLSGNGTFLLHPSVSVLTKNTGSLTLNGATQVTDTLFLGSTYVYMNGNTLTIGADADHPGVLDRTTGMFAGGSVKRWFAASTVSDILFPVAADGDRRFARISFTTAPSSAGTVTASFSASAPGSNGFPFNDGADLIAYPASFGYWTMAAGNGLSGGTYDIYFDAGNVTFPDIADLHLVKRANSSTDWSVAGTHAAATTESGPVTRLGRTGLTSFSDFAFGSTVGDSPYLEYSATVWNETGANNGRIDNSTPMTIMLNGPETFTGADNDDFVAQGKVTVGNLPSGLTAVIRRVSATSLSMTLNGLATANTAADSVNTMNLTFQNSAFTGSDANAVIFPSKSGLRLLFQNAYTPHLLAFDGVNDYVNIPSSVAPVRYTVELWVKPAATNNALLFVRTGAGGPVNEHSNELRIRNGLFEHFVYDGNEKTVTGTTAVVPGTWYHVAITAENSGMMRLYVNGVEEGSAQSIGALWGYGDRYQIGRAGDNMQWFNGSIDEVRIWDSVRTQQQIAGTMGQELTGTESGLLSYYDFNVGSGAAAYDLGPSAMDAALVNGVAWGAETIGGLAYDRTSFFESTVTSGTIDNTVPISITLTGTENFTGTNGSDLVSAGKVTVSNVPAGLTAVVTRTSAKSATLTLTGTASAHQPANNVSNIAIQFLNSAFSGNNAASIIGSQLNGVTITYLPPIPYRRSNTLVTFTKTNYSDPNQAANQDRITDNVWITRGANQGWYNAKIEGYYSNYYSPGGTEWAFGTTDNYSSLSYSTWISAIGGYPPGMVGQNMVVHLIADDLYLDVKVLSWQMGDGSGGYSGGGFSYQRSAVVPFQGLVYTDTIFSESSANDGAIDNSIPATIAVYGDTFTGGNGDDLVAAGKVVVSNVPAGLTAVVTRQSSSIATLTFTGQAAAHTVAQNDSLVTLSFQNSAFTGNHADSLLNTTKGAIITFDNAAITYSGTQFHESFTDAGTIGDTLVLTLHGETFTGANGDDLLAGGKVTVSNVPSGLNAVLKRTGPNQASLILAGTAAVHTFANSVMNLTVAFQNNAFAGNNAAIVDGATRNDLSILYDIGIPGNAMRFDGSNDYVNLPSGVYFNGNFTVEAWVYEYSYASWNRLLDFGNGAGSDNIVIPISTGTSGQVSIHVFQGGNSQSIQTTELVPLNQWTHVACVLNNGTATIYYNGVVVATGSVLVPLNITRTLNYIGKSNWGDAMMNATIDEFRIWNVARTPQQIREGMFHTVEPHAPGLTGYWQFNHQIGTTTLATVGPNGTLNNFNNTTGSGPVVSSVPAAYGATTTASVENGTTIIGDATLTMTDPFDAPVDVTVSVLHAAPFNLPGGYTSAVRDRYFILQPFGSPGTFSADLTVNFGAGMLDSRAEAFPAGVRLFQRPFSGTGSWTEIGGAVSASNSTGMVLWQGITTPGQYVAVYDASALPVELSSFSATAHRLNAELRWSTATEVNNNGFRIQRRKADTTAAAPWTEVSFVNGNGTSNAPKEYTFTDRVGRTGKYRYRLQQIDNDGRSGFSQEVEVMVGAAPLEFNLSQNYPNPFNPSTTIEFTVPATGRATLKVYNMVGQEVATVFDGMAEAGQYHTTQFDASRLASGIYLARLQSGNSAQVRKMVLMK